MGTLDISSYLPNLLSDIEIIYGKASLQLIMESKKINSENLISLLQNAQKEQQWLEDKEPLSTALKILDKS
ncbi:hypothetical protein KXQ54_004462 [Salmonella enterica]|uniref:Uncharacterized protein n=4 Tax=Salmonella enterica TaxID=28901 RepID=A0A2T8WQI5_SALET|nr:hypothetical protein [Salmonella enterica]EBE4010188.1 hypothetical protein [Salmonella enterica subsp. enterica serovar Muenchen]ECI4250837.1 hypothetical protein [Salmonella enterica subsp. enterica serovar Typhimurium]ECS7504714.1 hypothetical protein [Salmonella enterica subsp. enterica serovar Newport]ECT0951554.1 hypothetical protein [Salmonella enterica subsp. enterica serovar Saintpaul]ECT9308063.1 hypothetical protein [Salmonella enterica subsp. enterica serovar Montevideo]ECX3450